MIFHSRQSASFSLMNLIRQDYLQIRAEIAFCLAFAMECALQNVAYRTNVYMPSYCQVPSPLSPAKQPFPPDLSKFCNIEKLNIQTKQQPTLSKIRSLIFLVTFVTVFAAVTANNDHDHDHDHQHNDCPRTRHGCLCQEDTDHILSLWPRLFDTQNATFFNETINCILAEDFTTRNEGEMFFGTQLLPLPFQFISPCPFQI
jgi:hypothetical protein